MNLNQVTVPSTDVSTFSVHLAERTVSPSQTVVYFECTDLDQKVAALVKAGVKFTSPPTDEAWLWREARLQDPDGNVICLFHAGNNRLNPPWRLA